MCFLRYLLLVAPVYTAGQQAKRLRIRVMGLVGAILYI